MRSWPELYEYLPGNAIKIVLGDLNAKCGRKRQFSPTIEKESLYKISSENGIWIITFVTGKNIIISSIPTGA